MQVTDAGGGWTKYTYNQNDVLVEVGPAATGEITKKRQLEYDALGRLTSVCEVTSGTGSGNCGQTSSQTGYWTKYTYHTLDNLLTVTQNAQSGTTQARTYVYDMLGRVTSATDPESGTTTYTYDSIASGDCAGNYKGDLIKRADAFPNPNTNVTCYAYDSLHRLNDVTYPSGSYAGSTSPKHFVYDGATVNSVVMSNAKARLAEAYTGTLSSKTTDLGFSYSARGEAMDVYQSTPNSGSYYHVGATYWENGLIKTLSGVGLPALTYGNPDGEGRPYAFFEGTSTYRVTSAAYDLFSLPTGINFTSGDSDSFTNDPNTGRITQYKFNIGSPVQSVIGNLTWNQNGTLNQLAITDPFNSVNQQACTYSYDDLARILSANCGSIWNETFSNSDGGQGTGAFGNLTKTGISGATSFQPTYNTATNRITSVGSQNYTYDANGNMTSTGTGTGTSAYTWDAEGKMLSDAPNGSTTVNVTYDALGRVVEQARGSSYTQIVYGPQGSKLALMNGQTLSKAFVPLPGGATAVYNSSGLAYYRYPDWLGSSRFASTPGRAMYYDEAYAPYGENYAETGTTDRNFTGQNQDTTADLYDFLFREYHPTQGRWLSPDPLGGDISNPQSLNRYAYVLNNPTSLIDLLGLCPKGTHPAVPEEIDRILAAGKELINQTDPPIGYQKGRRHDNEGNLVSCDCSNFINIAINQAGFSVPQASTEQIFYQKDSGQYFQPVQNNSVSVGNVLLVSFPGQPVHSHAVLVASAAPLKVYGSQNSSGPASIPAEGRQLSAFYAEIFAGADAYEICIPDKAEGKKKESNVGTAPLSNLLNNVPNPYWLIWSLFPFGLSYVAPPPPYTEK